MSKDNHRKKDRHAYMSDGKRKKTAGGEAMAEAGASSSSGGSPAAKRKRSVEDDAPPAKKAKASISYRVTARQMGRNEKRVVIRLVYSVGEGASRKRFNLGNYHLSPSETMKIGISHLTNIAASVLENCHAAVTGDDSAKKESWEKMKLHSSKFISLFHWSEVLDASEGLRVLTKCLKNIILSGRVAAKSDEPIIDLPPTQRDTSLAATDAIKKYWLEEHARP